MGIRAAWTTINRHRQSTWSLLFLTTICLIVAWAAGNPAPAVPRFAGNVTSELMTLDDARRYMVDLINRDRATGGLPPVRLDPVASRAAQQHSDEMASYGYISHWDLSGRKPDQRYNEFGGRGAVFENVFTNHDQPYANFRAPLAARQLFSRRDIEQAEGWFFNQTPPHDRHRRNILDPNHKLVGIGISLSVHRTIGSRITVSEEFVHSPGELSVWSTDLIPGQVQKLTGKLSPEVSLAGMQLCREPLPRPMTTAQLKTTGEYNYPSQTVTCYTPETGGTGPLEVKKAPDGEEFSFALNTDKGWQDGLYYLVVWVRDSVNATPYIGSTRTVRISATPAPPPLTPPVLRESDVQVATGAQSARLAAARYPRYTPAPPTTRPAGNLAPYQGPRPSTNTAYSQPSPLRFPVPAAIASYAAYAPLSTAPYVPPRQYGMYGPPGGSGSQSGRRSGQIVPSYGPAPLVRNPNYVPPSAQGPNPARLERSATFVESAPTAVVPEHQAPKKAPPPSTAAPASLATKPTPEPAANKVVAAPPKPAAAARAKSPIKPAVWTAEPKQSLCPMEASD